MATCTHCHSTLPADAAFCPNCASPVTANAPSPVPESKTPATLSGLKTELETPAAASQTTQLTAGSEFHNRYIVQRLLGSGAMGMVYLVEDQLTQRQVALKLINPTLVNSPSVAQRFLREGLTARDIRHPNVIAMYDVGDDGGQLYLVMEYLSGETLRDWLHRAIQNHVDVPFATARSIIVKILEGLTAAHQSGVIHRDLKPENIMLIGDPQHAADYQLKILDFGIARAIDTASNTQLTSSGAATGTPLYMAPEQRTAADTVGPAADLYAVSMIFYELLMGVPATGILGQPAKERGDIPPAIDSILEKGLSSRPRSRFQSTQDYLAALQALDNEVPQKPEPRPEPNPEPRPEPRPEPNPEPKPGPKPDPDREQKPESKSSNLPAWLQTPRGKAIAVGVVVLAILGIIDEFGTEPPTQLPQQLSSQNTVQNPPQSPRTSTVSQPVTPIPSVPAIAGIWYDELVGMGVAHAKVELNQDDTDVWGDIYDLNNNVLGTFDGTLDGTTLRYDYDALGSSGSGIGWLQADGRHINITVTSDEGGVENHVLHKNHLPGN